MCKKGPSLYPVNLISPRDPEMLPLDCPSVALRQIIEEFIRGHGARGLEPMGGGEVHGSDHRHGDCSSDKHEAKRINWK